MVEEKVEKGNKGRDLERMETVKGRGKREGKLNIH